MNSLLFNHILGFSLNTIVLIVISVFVYRSRSNSVLHRAFAFNQISIAWWSFFTIFMITATTPKWGLFWDRVCLSGVVFIPATLFHYFVSFTRDNVRLKNIIRANYILSGVFLVMVWVTSLFVQAVKPKFGMNYFTVTGLGYAFFIAWFVLCVVGSLFFLAASIKSSTGILRRQKVLLLIFSILGYSGGTCNYLLAYNIHLPGVAETSNYGVLILSIGLAYIIFKYRFLDIQVLIKKTLVFAGLLAFVFGVYSVVTVFVRLLLSRFFAVNDFWATAISIFLIVLGYDAIRKFLINLTDQYLFQRRYDYHKVLKDASRGMAKIESLKHLLGLVLHFVTMKMRVESAVILSYENKERVYRVVALRGYKEAVRISLSFDHPIILRLLETREAIQLEDIIEEMNSSEGETDVTKIIIQDLISFQAQGAVPSFLNDELRNILLIGSKKSGESYTTEDISLLTTLAQESAIAIENARLYDEVIDRTRLLENTNKNLTDANQKLKVTQASLIVAEKNSTMVGMAKAIGHEVNNPLSTVAGRAGWIYKDELIKCRQIVSGIASVLPAEAQGLEKRFVNIEDNALRIEKSARRIEIVVKTLTDILKDTKGEISPLSLLVLVREAREATRFVTYEENLSGCQISEDIAANLIILGNLEQLLQVFVNLIKNSYEAMGKQADRSIEISANVDSEDPKMVKIQIKDNGPGMLPEVLKNIWKQGFSTKIRKSDEIGAAGQGQGLFICKHMIESVHGGVIFAESTFGQGTTFIIKLPMADLGG